MASAIQGIYASILNPNAWGTEEPVDVASTGFEPFSWTVSPDVQFLTDATLNNDTLPHETHIKQIGAKDISGSWVEPLRFEGLTYHLGWAMGLDAISGVGPYTHLISSLKDLIGVHFTLAWQENSWARAWSVPSAKLNRLKLTWETASWPMIEFGWRGSNVVANSAGAPDGLTSVTLRGARARANAQLASKLTFQAAAQASSLAAIELQSFELELARVEAVRRSSLTVPLIREPQLGPFTTSVKATLPRESAQKTYADNILAGLVVNKMLLKWIESAGATEFHVGLPSVVFQSWESPLDGQQMVDVPLTGTLGRAASVPSGMASGMTGPYFTVINANESAAVL